VDNETVTQTKFRTLFNQSEIVTSGKLKNDSTLFLNSRVIGLGASGITVLSNEAIFEDSFMSASFPKLMENIGIPRTLRDLTRAVIKFLFVIPLEA
jgi:hypothetical protein